MEIGWYLRFTKGATVEALVDAGSLGQLENQLRIVSGWELDTEERGEHLRAVFTRKTP